MRRATVSHLFTLAAVVAWASFAHAADDTALKLVNIDASNTGYIRIPNSAGFSLQTFTLEAWVQRTGVGYGQSTDPSGAAIIAKPRENTSGSNIASWHLHWTNAGEIHFNLTHTPTSSGVYLLSPAVATPLARHHLAVSFDGATVREYIDGALVASAAWSLGTVYYGADDVLLGADNFSFGYLRRFDGWIDDVRVWNYARSATEIANWMNCRLSGSETGLVAYYPFDGSNAADLTGHGHDGTAVATAGAVSYGALAPLSLCTVGVDDAFMPGTGELSLQIFPQPARDHFTVRFDLPRPGPVSVDVIDVAGRRLAVWEAGEYPAGRHQIMGDLSGAPARTAHGAIVFVRVRCGHETATRSLVLVP
jgi:hypothetical protein